MEERAQRYACCEDPLNNYFCDGDTDGNFATMSFAIMYSGNSFGPIGAACVLNEPRAIEAFFHLDIVSAAAELSLLV